MKNIKYVVLLIASIIVVTGVSVLIIFNINRAHENNILKDENAQREMLSNIYMDIINSHDVTITLDESALKNLITNEPFTDDTINYLTALNQFADNSSLNYVLCTEYNAKTHKLTIKLKSNTSEHTKKYTISVKSGKILYVPDELSTNYEWFPISEKE